MYTGKRKDRDLFQIQLFRFERLRVEKIHQQIAQEYSSSGAKSDVRLRIRHGARIEMTDDRAETTRQRRHKNKSKEDSDHQMGLPTRLGALLIQIGTLVFNWLFQRKESPSGNDKGESDQRPRKRNMDSDTIGDDDSLELMEEGHQSLLELDRNSELEEQGDQEKCGESLSKQLGLEKIKQIARNRNLAMTDLQRLLDEMQVDLEERKMEVDLDKSDDPTKGEIQAELQAWMDAYTLLEEYLGKHKHTNVPAEQQYKGFSLGQWVWEQRLQYKQYQQYYADHERGIPPPLLEFQIMYLDVIGFDWEGPPHCKLAAHTKEES